MIVGWRSDDEIDLYKRYAAFEEKYKHRKSKGELKSTTIRQSQLVNGFASLNNENTGLFNDFLSLFNEKTHVYYAIISKVEFIINQLFIDYKNSLFVDMDAMKYSITKALVLYQPKEIIEGLYEDTEELVALLKNFFVNQIPKYITNLLKLKRISQKSLILSTMTISGIIINTRVTGCIFLLTLNCLKNMTL